MDVTMKTLRKNTQMTQTFIKLRKCEIWLQQIQWCNETVHFRVNMGSPEGYMPMDKGRGLFFYFNIAILIPRTFQ